MSADSQARQAGNEGPGPRRGEAGLGFNPCLLHKLQPSDRREDRRALRQWGWGEGRRTGSTNPFQSPPASPAHPAEHIPWGTFIPAASAMLLRDDGDDGPRGREGPRTRSCGTRCTTTPCQLARSPQLHWRNASSKERCGSRCREEGFGNWSRPLMDRTRQPPRPHPRHLSTWVLFS